MPAFEVGFTSNSDTRLYEYTQMDRWLQIGLGRMRDALRRLKGHRLTDRMFFATVGAMRALKQTLDPQGIFNPGKIAFGVNRFSRLQ